MTRIRAISCLAAAMLLGVGLAVFGACGGSESTCDTSARCCCLGDTIQSATCSGGAPACPGALTLHSGAECSTGCGQAPVPQDGGHDEGTGVDARDADADGDADETNACAEWDADWGDAPKPDVASPCRSSCDCPTGMHCCAAAGGTTCAPAAECP